MSRYFVQQNLISTYTYIVYISSAYTKITKLTCYQGELRANSIPLFHKTSRIICPLPSSLLNQSRSTSPWSVRPVSHFHPVYENAGSDAHASILNSQIAFKRYLHVSMKDILRMQISNRFHHLQENQSWESIFCISSQNGLGLMGQRR